MLAGDEEAHPLDEEFLTRARARHAADRAGSASGIDRLLMVLTDAPSLRDLILFPHHRPRELVADPGRIRRREGATYTWPRERP